MSILYLKGPLTAIQRERIHVNEENKEILILKGMFALQKDNVLAYLNGLGSHVHIMFTNLDDEELCETLVQYVAELIVNLADGVESIQSECCENNLPADTLPPCLPRAYSVMSPCEFVELVM